MSLKVLLKPDFEFYDERGSIVQLVHDGFKQINVLISKKGTIRGNHFHKKIVEAFYIIKGEVVVTFLRDSEKEKITFKKGDFFLVEPFVRHSMFFCKDSIMVQMYSSPVINENKEKDIFNED